MTGDGLLARVDARLAAVRADGPRRRRATVAAVVAGLAAAWLHWIGLVVAGAAVGLTRRNLRRAVASGVLVGAATVGATVLIVPAISPEAFASLSPVNYVTAAVGVVLPVWGSLARGVA